MLHPDGAHLVFRMLPCPTAGAQLCPMGNEGTQRSRQCQPAWLWAQLHPGMRDQEGLFPRKSTAGLRSPDLPRCERWRKVGVWLRFDLDMPWKRLVRIKKRL